MPRAAITPPAAFFSRRARRTFASRGRSCASIRGNGIWTHSLYTSPRNGRGLIRAESLRDCRAATPSRRGTPRMSAWNDNAGTRIGFPAEDVDVESRAVPVAHRHGGQRGPLASYARNRFEEINGKCIDLDGFHDGEIRGNVCVNRAAPEQYRFGNYGIVMNNSNPDMQSRNIRIVDNVIDGPLFGGIFVIGTGHGSRAIGC